MTPATSPARGPRPGFSLIELLVVISILGVLAALVTAGVQKAREYGDRTRIQADLSNLDNGVSEFKRAMKASKLPAFGQPVGQFGDDYNRFRLRRFYRDMSNGGLGTKNDPGPQSAEAQFLKTVFPNMYLDPQTQRSGMPAGVAAADQQHGTGLPNLDLTPNQALVFFLGGYYMHVDASSAGSVATARRQVWLQGYLTDPRMPFRFDAPLANQPTGKRETFFAFPPNQLDIDFALIDPPSGTPELLDRASGNAKLTLAPSFLDTYGTPYLYVSHHGTNGNDYESGGWPAGGLDPNGFEYFTTPARDNKKKVDIQNGAFGNSTSTKFAPFKLAANRYSNEKTQQIVSAGKDKIFGPGGLFKAATSDAYAEGRVGGDDYTNFSGGKMAGAQ